MADKSIHELPVASLLTDAGLLVVYQDGKTQSIRGELIKQYAAQGVSQYVEEAKTAAQTAGDAAGEAQAAAEEAKGVALYPPQVNPETGMWQTWDAAQQQYVDTDQKAEGPRGPAGSSIQSIERTSGTGAPGTTDTYTVTLTNGSTTTFQVYNGADGAGTGDFKADGSVPMTGALQMAGHTISGLPAPVADSDPVRKQDVPTLAADRQLSNLDTPQTALVNLGAGVRPNFLDNAYFVGGGAEFGVFPVKYKEMSEIISTPGYFIPRWKLISGSVKVTADGLFLNGKISQIIPASIGTACSAVAVTASEIIEAEYDNESRIFTISASEKTIIFAKLETGENQTAAYQKNGQVIFLAQNVPNYALTLSKCQSYSVLFGSTGAYSPIGMGQARSDQDLVVVIPTPETMRIAPVAKISGYITARNQNIYVQMTSVVVEAVGPGTVLVSFQAENLIPGAAYDVFCTPGNFLELNAEP